MGRWSGKGPKHPYVIYKWPLTLSIAFALLASLLLSITIKPWFTSFAMVSIGIFKTFLTNTSFAITCIWISDVDVAVAVTGFAKVT